MYWYIACMFCLERGIGIPYFQNVSLTAALKQCQQLIAWCRPERGL